MKTLIILLITTLTAYVGKFASVSAPEPIAEVVHSINYGLSEIASSDANINSLHGTNNEDQQTIDQHIAAHPDEAPYWFGLLSTLTTALVAAIIRVLEKQLIGQKFLAKWRARRNKT